MKRSKQLFRLVYLTKRFPYLRLRQRTKATLILVRNDEENCRNRAEKELYKKLRESGYYPTPCYEVAGIVVNIALVPFRLALIEKHPNLDEKRLNRLFRKKGWRVLFYQQDQVIRDAHDYLREIKQQARPTKNISV
ncbi:hypothetical protein [Bacillus sp. FJAT-45037]|uniref:hypothetical protein n=1 Tax=Bacillus sp. FJAT-45037 TaxID=2011007 RepID=UPI000C24CFB7|nr:hypothetical protein [Bacillus sp. FJAT-45037]